MREKMLFIVIIAVSICMIGIMVNNIIELENENNNLKQEIVWFNEMNELKRNGSFDGLKEKIKESIVYDNIAV